MTTQRYLYFPWKKYSFEAITMLIILTLETWRNQRLTGACYECKGQHEFFCLSTIYIFRRLKSCDKNKNWQCVAAVLSAPKEFMLRCKVVFQDRAHFLSKSNFSQQATHLPYCNNDSTLKSCSFSSRSKAILKNPYKELIWFLPALYPSGKEMSVQV